MPVRGEVSSELEAVLKEPQVAVKALERTRGSKQPRDDAELGKEPAQTLGE